MGPTKIVSKSGSQAETGLEALC